MIPGATGRFSQQLRRSHWSKFIAGVSNRTLTTFPMLERFKKRLKPFGRTGVVYTCLFGYSEGFNDLVYEPDRTIDFICFTDTPELQSNFWRVKIVDRGDLDPAPSSEAAKNPATPVSFPLRRQFASR